MTYRTSGIPTSADAWLPRGILYVGEIVPATAGVAFYRDVGNCPSVNLSNESNEVVHRLSYDATRTIDDRVTLDKDYSLSFTVDSTNFDNMAWWLQGETGAYGVYHSSHGSAGLIPRYTNPVYGAATIPNASFVLASQIRIGRWYNLISSAGTRLYNILQTSHVAVTTQTTGTALVLGVDYTLDLSFGRFFILDTIDITRLAEASTEGLKATITRSTSVAEFVQEIKILQGVDRDVSLLFKAINPRNNNQTWEYFFPRWKGAPTADLPLISDDWGTIEFEGQLLRAQATGTMQTDIAAAPYGWLRAYANAQPGVTV